jgi:hypothetical protein
MHPTATRLVPLDLPLPQAHAAFGIDGRKDFRDFQSQRNPVYFGAPVRNGLHTPPADDMGTTYQQPQYNQYGSQPDTFSSQGGVSQSSYAGACSGSGIQGRQYSIPHSSLNQLPPPLASTMRNDIHVSSQPPYRVPSPVQTADLTNLTTFTRSEEQTRRSSASGSAISKSLQIPSSINNSGGSLAEFAAQVRKDLSL